MIYLDSSIVLAAVLSEARRPPAALWSRRLISSVPLRYEVVGRLHANRASPPMHREAAKAIAAIDLVALEDGVLARALQPFPGTVRTLDGLHLATADHLSRRHHSLELATYDLRLAAVASAMGVQAAPTSVTG